MEAFARNKVLNKTRSFMQTIEQYAVLYTRVFK